MVEFGKSPENANLNSRRQEYIRVTNFRQYSWYVFALFIYLFCAAAGFGLAYFFLRFLINIKVHP